MIEQEIKIMLTKGEYDAVCGLFAAESVIVQKNHYFACERGRELMTSIRVREIDDEFFLQVKAPISSEGSLSIKREFEKKLNALPQALDRAELLELTGTDFGETRFIGTLETERRLTHPNPQTEVCVDKNSYLGVTDYELEIEYTGDYPRETVEFLRKNGITAEKKAVGKYGRFCAAAGLEKA